MTAGPAIRQADGDHLSVAGQFSGGYQKTATFTTPSRWHLCAVQARLAPTVICARG